MPFFLTTSRDKTLTMPAAAAILLAASLGALAFVLVMQYVFGLQPCILCQWQRAPYEASAALSLLALLWRPYRRQTALVLLACTACFLAGFSLAIFHSGVELHWWLGTSSCSVRPLGGASPDDLRVALLHTVSARCDEIAWTLLGLSMANWNVLLSLALSFFATAAVVKAVKD